MFARPPEGSAWTKQDFARFWEGFEKEFGLEKQPFAEAIHDDGEHEHRVYSLVRVDGTTIRMSNDYARREKLERVAEFERGEAFTKGAHNRAVVQALDQERPDVAAAMRAAKLHEGPRPVAPLTPQERAQQERTTTSKQGVAQAVAIAWAASDSGQAFAAALAEHGLVLARGDQRGGMPVVVDHTGNTHAVTRMFSMAAKANDLPAPPAADVAARLDGMALPSVAEARQNIAAQSLPPPNGGPPSPDMPQPPGGEEAAPVSTDAPHANAPVGHAGAAPAHAAVHAASGACLDDAGPGPGEPPGPGARPEEITRYRAALATYAERRDKALQAFMRSTAAASEATHQAATTGGGHHGTGQQPTGHTWHQWWPAAVSTAVEADYTAEEARAAVRANGLDGRGSRPGSHGAGAEQGHDRAGGGDGAAARGDHSGHTQADRRGVEPAARPDRPASIGGAEPDNGNPVRVDGCTGIATEDRAAAGAPAADARAAVARRAAEARLAHDLARQPEAMDRMRQARQEFDPAWRETRDAQRRSGADQARINAILSTHPHPDLASRDPAARANAYAHAISERTRQSTAAVDAAQADAAAAVQGRSRATRILAFIGIATNEQRQAESLVARAIALTDAAASLPSRDDYKRARANGEAHAYAAQQTTAAWEQRPEVAAAMEQHRLNQAVQQAMAARDQAINAAMDAGGPAAARAIIRAREEEQDQHAATAAHLPDLTHGPHAHGGSTPRTPDRR